MINIARSVEAVQNLVLLLSSQHTCIRLLLSWDDGIHGKCSAWGYSGGFNWIFMRWVCFNGTPSVYLLLLHTFAHMKCVVLCPLSLC